MGLEPEGEDLPIPGAHRPGVVTKAGLVLFGNDGRMVRVLLRLLVCTVGSGPAGRPLAILEKTGKGDHRIQEGRPSPAGSATFPSQEGLPRALTDQVPCPSWGPWGASESGGLIQRTLCPGLVSAQQSPGAHSMQSFLLFE